MGVFILLVNDIIRVYDSHIKCFREFKCLCLNLISEIITYYSVCMASCSWNGICNSISDLCSEWILKVLNDYKLVQTPMLLSSFCFVLALFFNFPQMDLSNLEGTAFAFGGSRPVFIHSSHGEWMGAVPTHAVF